MHCHLEAYFGFVVEQAVVAVGVVVVDFGFGGASIKDWIVY